MKKARFKPLRQMMMCCVQIFDSIKDELDDELEVWNSKYPEGPGLTEGEAELFWDEYEERIINHSLSAPVHPVTSPQKNCKPLLPMLEMITLSLVKQVFAYFQILQLKNFVIM